MIQVATNKFKQPIFVTGQGSSNNHIIWLFLPGILIKMMHRVATGASYTINNQHAVPFYLSTLVDNVNSHHTTTQNIQTSTVNMVHDFKCWKHFTSIKWRQIIKQKCNSYIRKWDFQNTSRPTSTLMSST
jgi:hypothetical protein